MRKAPYVKAKQNAKKSRTLFCINSVLLPERLHRIAVFAPSASFRTSPECHPNTVSAPWGT